MLGAAHGSSRHQPSPKGFCALTRMVRGGNTVERQCLVVGKNAAEVVANQNARKVAASQSAPLAGPPLACQHTSPFKQPY